MDNNYDVFLMGTAGDYNDPNRSQWREPIKAELYKHGLTYLDPVVPDYNEKHATQENIAFGSAKVLAMYIDTTTTAEGSLAESGWLVAKALLDLIGMPMRQSTAGLFMYPTYVVFRVKRYEMPKSQLTEAQDNSRRARNLLLQRIADIERIANSYPVALPFQLCGTDEEFQAAIMDAVYRRHDAESADRELRTRIAAENGDFDNSPF